MNNKASNKMIVIGGGVIGVATILELCLRGIPAILIEAEDDLALETSFANGGMLTPSQPEPWNGPNVLGHLFASLFFPNSAMKMHWPVLPQVLGWGLNFLQNSVPVRARKSAEVNFLLARHSAKCIEQLEQKFNLQFDQSSHGSLKIFLSQSEFEKSCKMAERLRDFGLRFEALDPNGAVAKEPQLSMAKDHIKAAIYYPDDRMGDARKFTLELAKQAKNAGAIVRLQTKVTGLIRQSNQIIGVKTLNGEFFGQVVVCAGTNAANLLGSLGIKLPIQPVKGYSITLDGAGLTKQMPVIPVIDEAKHIAITPIGSNLRLVGMAEFAGFNHSLPNERLQILTSVFNRVYPHLTKQLDWQTAIPWTGLRPMSADGVPIIGASSIDGLWLNSGHGHLGWTMAAGAANLLVDLIKGTKPATDPKPYAFSRWS